MDLCSRTILVEGRGAHRCGGPLGHKQPYHVCREESCNVLWDDQNNVLRGQGWHVNGTSVGRV